MFKNLIKVLFIFLGFVKLSAQEKEISFSIMEAPKSLDPHLIINENDIYVTAQIYEGLVRVNEKNEIEAAIAEKWEVKGNKVKFYIRENAKWSNGLHVLADDFVYAFERALNPETGSSYSYLLHSLHLKNSERFSKGEVEFKEVGIKALSDKELELDLDIKFEDPLKVLAPILSFVTATPISRSFITNIEEYAKDEESILSNGAWMIKYWIMEDKFVLVKNPFYYNKDNIKIDRINIFIVRDETTVVNMYKNGDLNFLLKISPNHFNYFKSIGDLKVLPGDAVVYLEFNTKDSVMSNKNIRKAISFAIGREQLAKNILNNTVEPLNAVVPLGFSGKKGDFRIENKRALFKDDISKAKTFLRKGLEELKLSKLNLTLLCDNDETYQKTAQYIQQQLNKNLNIEISIESINKSLRISRQIQGDYQFAISMWAADYASNPATFIDRFHTTSGSNFTRWSNSKFDELIKNSELATKYQNRISHLIEAEKLISDEEIGEFPTSSLYTRLRIYASKPNIKGIRIYPGSYIPDLRSVDIVR